MLWKEPKSIAIKYLKRIIYNKMQILYISPSTIPSRAANSIHVINQCDALSLDNEVTLICHTNFLVKNDIYKFVRESFQLSFKKVKLITLPKYFRFGINFFIGLIAVFNANKSEFDLIISRNLYASFIFSNLLKKRTIYEIHLLEFGFRKFIQSQALKSRYIKTITISSKLKHHLEVHHNLILKNNLVLHDAANNLILNNRKITDQLKIKLLKEKFTIQKENYKAVVGYFGHLYEGRGIEIIEGIALINPNIIFIVAGGNTELINKKKAENKIKNLKFLGFLPYIESREAMLLCDLLLMPYQKKVFLSKEIYDTSKWMSPMKMFEYLSSRVPLIASDLPVLKEVLKHEKNCILVECNNVEAWSKQVNKLVNNKNFARYLSNNGFNDFITKFTWQKRAEKLIEFGKKK